MMKRFFLAALLALVAFLSYEVGYMRASNRAEKDMQAACLLSDFLRFTIDQWEGEEIYDGGVELENSFEEYFGDIEYYGTEFSDGEELLQYCWSY